jgi:phosphohistidine phosphatase
MPRLLLLRHAKAERTRPGEPDRDRPLSQRGRTDAEAIGKVIARRGERPDLVLCSTAARTRQTWEHVRPALAAEPQARFLDAVYDADDYLGVLRAEGGDVGSLLVIGHNPAVQTTAVALAADVSRREGADLASHFPTAAVAILEFDGAWARLGERTMRLVAFLRPPDG